MSNEVYAFGVDIIENFILLNKTSKICRMFCFVFWARHDIKMHPFYYLSHIVI